MIDRFEPADVDNDLFLQIEGLQSVSRGLDDLRVGVGKPVELPENVRQELLDGLPPWPDGQEVETEVAGVVEDRLETLGYK